MILTPRTPPRRAVLPAVVGRISAGLGVVLAVGALDAAVRLVRLRRRGRLVPSLDHAVTTPGTTPSRRLVVLGDSAAAGHALASADEALGRRLARALTRGDGRATELVSVAVDGATTAEVAVTQLDAAQDAEVVVLGVGVNDAVDPWRRTADAAAALDALLGALHARLAPGAAVVLLSCPDLSAAPGLPWLIRPWVGRRCRALARRQGAVAVRHGVAVVAAPRAVLTLERFGADGFHPGASGHEELARRVVAALGGRVLDGVEGDAG